MTLEPLPTAREVLEPRRPLVIAHRGASAIAPENTLPAFAAALELGVDMVEFDFAHSADDLPLVSHDATLDRTTDAAGHFGRGARLAGLTASELAKLDAGSWFAPEFAGTRIPTLVETLELITPRAIALAERKAGSAQVLPLLLARLPHANRVIVQAFDWGYLADCRRLLPDVPLAALGERALTDAHITEALALGALALGWEERFLESRAIERAHAAGLKVFAWTVDQPDRMRELLAAGIDGVITNRPDLLKPLFE